MVSVINDFGFGSVGFSAKDFSKPNLINQIGYPPLRIDILTSIDGVTFEECFRNRKEAEIDGIMVNFIGYQDLLKNKRKSGRLKDLDDLNNLK